MNMASPNKTYHTFSLQMLMKHYCKWMPILVLEGDSCPVPEIVALAYNSVPILMRGMKRIVY